MEPKQAKSVFSRIGLGLAAFLIIQQVVATGIIMIVGVAAPDLMTTGWFNWVVSYGALYLIGFPVLLLILRGIPDSTGGSFSQPKTMNASHILLLIVISMGIVYPFNMLTTLIGTLLQQLTGQGLENPLAAVILGSNPWVNIIFAVVVAPVMEEILFRGILYKKLIRFGGKTFVFFSALVFALMHPNLYQVIYAFLLGVLFGFIRYYTGSIKYSIILHMSINMIGSGVGPLLHAYAGETAMMVLGYIVIALMLIGLVLGITWIVRNQKALVFEPGEMDAPPKKTIVLNAGMIVYMALFVIMVALTVAAPYFSWI